MARRRYMKCPACKTGEMLIEAELHVPIRVERLPNEHLGFGPRYLSFRLDEVLAQQYPQGRPIKTDWFITCTSCDHSATVADFDPEVEPERAVF